MILERIQITKNKIPTPRAFTIMIQRVCMTIPREVSDSDIAKNTACWCLLERQILKWNEQVTALVLVDLVRT